MANWLEKIIPPPAIKQDKQNSLPVNIKPGGLSTQGSPLNKRLPRKIPNASIVYIIAAIALVAMSLYNMSHGRWFTGLLILFPAACFVGYAWYYYKNAV